MIDYQPDTQNNTDESNCANNHWRCDDEFRRCNKIWNCLDGRDELDCTESDVFKEICIFNGAHFCFNLTTGDPFCLPKEKAGDGHIDCVGSIDERSFCRMKYPMERARRYRCQNSDKCITPVQVCDCHQDCPLNDDETVACHWLNNGREPFCDPTRIRCRDGHIRDCPPGETCRCSSHLRTCPEYEDNLFCDLIDRPKPRFEFTDTFPTYPVISQSTIARTSSLSNGFIAWHCNYGLLVQSTEEPSHFHCLCQDYYYGDRCQYQRKRITLILQPILTESFNSTIVIKIVVLLIQQNNHIVSHDQFFYVPRAQCLAKYFIQLLYPMNESWSSSMNYSVHVHAFIANTLVYSGSWKWDVTLNFLPVIRMVKRIHIISVDATDRPNLKNMYNGDCHSCSNASTCLGFDSDIGRDVCVCPLNYIGRRCLIYFNPCKNTSCNGHGECIGLDTRYNDENQFRCSCDPGWYGPYCTTTSARIEISFAPNTTYPSYKLALAHVLTSEILVHISYLYRMQEDTSSFHIFLDDFRYLTGLAFIQLFENLDRFDIYFLANYQSTPPLYHLWRNISIEIHPSRRCRPIQEIFNQTVLQQTPLGRIKYFQQPCHNLSPNITIYCFYDEKLLCLCDATNYTRCFNFDTVSSDCQWNKCSSRGKCIQNHAKCPKSSSCLCEPCSYGSICQFTTNGYAMSLDAILGSHIRIKPSRNIRHQSNIIRISVVILSIFIIFGISFNVFSIGTFFQSNTRQVGCGWYLLISSFIGLFTMIALIFKIIFLINVEQGNISCSLIEFLLKWLPTTSEWLHACVAIERALAVTQETRFSYQSSLRRAKWIIVTSFVVLGGVSSTELMFRRAILDTQDERVWCAFDMKTDKRIWQQLYSISNLIIFIIPLAINFITSGIIIVGTVISKARTEIELPDNIDQDPNNDKLPNKNHRKENALRKRLDAIKTQIIKYKHILVAPALLGAFSTSRVILAFIFVCTKLDRNSILNLFIYLVGFVPSMAILFAFVLPSEGYRESCLKFIKSMIPKTF